jgi:hypothetical protein
MYQQFQYAGETPALPEIAIRFSPNIVLPERSFFAEALFDGLLKGV